MATDKPTGTPTGTPASAGTEEGRGPVLGGVQGRSGRRVVLAVALVAASATAVALLRSPAPLNAAQGDAQTVAHDASWFAGQVASAWEQLKAGTLDPSSGALPVRVATDGRATVVLSAVLDDGVCYFGGVVEAGPVQVFADTSGEACSPELFAELTAALSPAASAATSPPDPVRWELERHVASAARFSSLTLPASFHGWAPPPPAVGRVAADGRSVEVELAGWCASVSLGDAAASPVRLCR